MGGELWSKSKSKSKSIAESLLFKALIRCALSKEGISLKAGPSKASIFALIRNPPKKIADDEDIDENENEIKKYYAALAAAALAAAGKKDKFYELCGVSEADLNSDYSDEIKKMERELYGDLDAFALSGKKTEAMKKVEEFERKRFIKIYGDLDLFAPKEWQMERSSSILYGASSDPFLKPSYQIFA